MLNWRLAGWHISKYVKCKCAAPEQNTATVTKEGGGAGLGQVHFVYELCFRSGPRSALKAPRNLLRKHYNRLPHPLPLLSLSPMQTHSCNQSLAPPSLSEAMHRAESRADLSPFQKEPLIRRSKLDYRVSGGSEGPSHLSSITQLWAAKSCQPQWGEGGGGGGGTAREC